jgi:hypothetical protein
MKPNLRVDKRVKCATARIRQRYGFAIARTCHDGQTHHGNKGLRAIAARSRTMRTSIRNRMHAGMLPESHAEMIGIALQPSAVILPEAGSFSPSATLRIATWKCTDNRKHNRSPI